ncbi:MAG TPA: pseudouridine synthase, partial [Chloroflexaceae bacterium]|nr:pseudouridine synthase [Chloroflexaceae bacterium]
MSAERLQKVLASAGIASRRDCEALIAAGRVTVNGRVVQEPGTRVDPEQDVVLVDGEPVRQPTRRTYLMLHKPAGIVSTVDDPHGRPTVVSLVDVPARVFPVGRLDVDSEGLILLTDDGELTHHLTHPKFEVEKEYRVLLDRPLDADALREWRNGLMLNGELTAPAKVALTETVEEGVWYTVVLREGRKRQIRETARTLGYEVRRLIRVREGELLLGDLPLREYRSLTDDEVSALRAHVPAQAPRDEAAAESHGRRAGAAAAGAAAGAAYGRRQERDGEGGRPQRGERDYGRQAERPRGYGPSRERADQLRFREGYSP